MVDGTTAALTPSAVSLAATWDIDIVAGIGELIATEVRDKKADILLAPTGKNHLSRDRRLRVEANLNQFVYIVRRWAAEISNPSPETTRSLGASLPPHT